MDEQLKNQVAVITGGSRGLGLAIAQAYARAGARVVIASRTERAVAQAVEMLNASGAQATGVACNVAEMAQVQALAAHALKTFGGLDIWVNNAGVSAPYGPTAHIPAENFMPVVNTNIIGTYNGSMVALRHMIPQRRGKLLNILGRGDKNSIKFQNAYSSSKVWERSFTKTLADEYKDSGVGIFGFNPGLVRTELLSQVQAVGGYESKLNPLRVISAMWGNEAEVSAEKAVWLASAATDGKTGMMVTMLTPGFMFRRAVGMGLRYVTRQPLNLPDLNVEGVPPVPELASAPAPS